MIHLDILPGDILFVWGESILDDAIELVSRGPSHCALVLDGQTLAEAQAGRETGIAYLADYQVAKEKQLEVWTDPTLTHDERKRIVDFAKSKFGEKYDYLAILAELARFEIGVPINSFHEGKRRICSSFVNDCGKSVGRNWSNLPYTPAPVDLLKGGKLTRKGVLSHG